MKSKSALFFAIMLCCGIPSSYSAATTATEINVGTGNTFPANNHNNSIAGGYGNVMGGTNSIIGGGQYNTANGLNSIVGGGDANYLTNGTASGLIAGGGQNHLNGSASVIGGGGYHVIKPLQYFYGTTTPLPAEQIGSSFSVIAGGYANEMYSVNSVVSGGVANRIEPASGHSAISGGVDNVVGYGSGYSVISGGGNNRILKAAFWASINGGQSNVIEGNLATTTTVMTSGEPADPNHYGWIGGGRQNIIYENGRFASICGGANNTNEAYLGFLGGGCANEVGEDADAGTVAGGFANHSEGSKSTIGGGYINTASGASSTISGGENNTAGGAYAAIPGGANNAASGTASLAAGWRAKATQNGSFVFADYSGADITSPAANTFTVRASGGIWLGTSSSPSIGGSRFIDTSTGAYLSSGGAWTASSDRNKKENFKNVESKAVLEKVASLPIKEWNYKAEDPSIRHIGPVAQDFYAAFGIGQDNLHIATIDADGIAFASIQALNEIVQEKDAKIRSLEERLQKIEAILTKSE